MHIATLEAEGCLHSILHPLMASMTMSLCMMINRNVVYVQ